MAYWWVSYPFVLVFQLMKALEKFLKTNSFLLCECLSNELRVLLFENPYYGSMK